uniref:RNA polymerase, sigma-24 subunit, ECF subfamily n=1 Tax=Rhodopseudomonas palustris (strain BisA53) TaxID=316055 RepID=Q07N77_RHOP5
MLVREIDWACVMIDPSRSALLDTLVDRYDDFKRRLTSRLGSPELACEALQDTFLRLASTTVLGTVQSPHAYVLRTAFNIAINRLVAEKRRVNSVDTDTLIEIADDAPSPMQIVEARSDLEALKYVLHELPRRRREIVVAVALNEVPIPVLAKRFGVTVRTIQIELKQALLHCSERLERRPQAILARRPLRFDETNTQRRFSDRRRPTAARSAED